MLEIEKLNFSKSQVNEWSKIALDISNQLFYLMSSEQSYSFKSYAVNKFQSLLDSKSKYLQKVSQLTNADVRLGHGRIWRCQYG